mmetsp:Transcript_39612/g.85612  ORF Transcript_39612/g.85612 Transcript_39612/m.85612 type:complete len:94 (-) Transcript_39612:294-575(-)
MVWWTGKIFDALPRHLQTLYSGKLITAGDTVDTFLNSPRGHCEMDKFQDFPEEFCFFQKAATTLAPGIRHRFLQIFNVRNPARQQKISKTTRL